MKRFILLFTVLPILCISQQTYVPDDAFENHLETHDYNDNLVLVGDPTSMGNGIANDNYVTTANISSVTYLGLDFLYIADLTGIEDFTVLTTLWCHYNQLTSLDLSNNIALTELYCADNQLTSLDISNNTALITLILRDNQLTSLDLSNHTALETLNCSYNQLTSLDLSNHTALTYLWCSDNPLICLNIKNGNNQNMVGCLYGCLNATNNPYLTCIEVDDSVWASNNLTTAPTLDPMIDTQTTFNINCNNSCSSSSVGTVEYTTKTSLYPNPTNDLITLDISGYNGSINVEVFDLSGRLLKSTNNTTISLKDYAKGIYVFRVSYGDIVEELKVVKD